jgi:hypothetical protein
MKFSLLFIFGSVAGVAEAKVKFWGVKEIKDRMDVNIFGKLEPQETSIMQGEQSPEDSSRLLLTDLMSSSSSTSSKGDSETTSGNLARRKQVFQTDHVKSTTARIGKAKPEFIHHRHRPSGHHTRSPNHHQ